jgi:hypothetical protein
MTLFIASSISWQPLWAANGAAPISQSPDVNAIPANSDFIRFVFMGYRSLLPCEDSHHLIRKGRFLFDTEPRAYRKIWLKDGPRSSRIAVFRSTLSGLNVGHPIYFCVFVPSALVCKRTRVNETRRTYPGSSPCPSLVGYSVSGRTYRFRQCYNVCRSCRRRPDGLFAFQFGM